MRLFTGIALAPAVIEKISAALEELRPTTRIDWSPIENLHITCRFIGAWPEDRLDELKTALNTVPPTGPVLIHVSNCGFFPNPHRPYSYFAEVQATPALTALVTGIDQALLPLGFTVESRPYHPHVTLARIKAPTDLHALPKHKDFSCFEARDFHLYESVALARGSVYKKLATYDLMRENSTIQ